LIEVTYCMRRKAGLSHEDFVAHWEGVHVPIVLANLQALRLASYQRTLPLRHAYSERVERRRTMQLPYDGIAQLAWASEADMRHAFESEEALAVQRVLAQDEALFVDAAGSCRCVSRTISHL
jgi:hypothetical protein